MKIHYFQHVPFEDPVFILEWARYKGFRISSTQFYQGESLPDFNQVDLVLIMGGTMSIHDEKAYPWLKEEKEFIKQAIEKDKPILGICLGAQLLADVLGAKVFKNKYKEIGWFPVKRARLNQNSPIEKIFPEEFMAFHWHGETFDIPEHAYNIGSSAACSNQGFIYKDNVIGLQFHLESTEKSIKNLINNCGNELVEDTFIQTREIILSQCCFLERTNRIMSGVLEYLIQRVTL